MLHFIWDFTVYMGSLSTKGLSLVSSADSFKQVGAAVYATGIVSAGLKILKPLFLCAFYFIYNHTQFKTIK